MKAGPPNPAWKSGREPTDLDSTTLNPLGSALVNYELEAEPNPLLYVYGSDLPINIYLLYGISEQLTVPGELVPEPSTIAMTGLGAVLALALANLRRAKH
jgi:hypothetical protein